MRITKIITNAYKMIVSYATIYNNVFSFLRNRDEKNKILIEN